MFKLYYRGELLNAVSSVERASEIIGDYVAGGFFIEKDFCILNDAETCIIDIDADAFYKGFSRRYNELDEVDDEEDVVDTSKMSQEELCDYCESEYEKFWINGIQSW